MREIKYNDKTGLYLPEHVDRKIRNSGYAEAGGSLRRKALKGFVPNSRGAREDIDECNSVLRQRSRMLYMSTPIATSAINIQRTNVIGVGLQFKAKLDRDVLGIDKERARQWQSRTHREFNLWADKKRACDATGINTLSSIAQLAFVTWLLSGDCFVLLKHVNPTPLMPYSLRLHVIEADRVRTPVELGAKYPYITVGQAENGNKIYDGVEVDAGGAIVAYYVHNTYPHERTTEQESYVRIEAYGRETGLPNVLHIMYSERPEQYRGVPFLAPVIEQLGQLKQYSNAELAAALLQSIFTAYIKTAKESDDGIPLDEADPDAPVTYRDPNDYKAGPGTAVVLPPGSDVSFANPTRPNSTFEAFTHTLFEQVGAGLEIPVDVLLKSYDASYSASRAAILDLWKGIKMRRAWFTEDFYEPLYEVWLSEAVARGRVYAPGFFNNPITRGAYLGAEWIGPSQGQIDPVKEITAEALAIELGISTHEQSTIRVNGGSWEDNVEQLEVENEMLSKAQAKGQMESGQESQPVSNVIKNTVRAAIKEMAKGE